MISILAVLFVLSPNADTGRVQQLTARLYTHEQRLHPVLKESIRTQVLPNLSSYDALYRDIAEQLQTREDLYPLLGSLDMLRRADITTWTDDTAPSSRWIYLKWNWLLTLSLRLERLDSILETSGQTISTLKDEANQYLLASHTTRLSVFMTTYERRRPQLSTLESHCLT